MIRIDELNIRMPGHNKEQGKAVSRQVAKNLSVYIPSNNREAHLPEIKISLQHSETDDISVLANKISEQIITHIESTT